MDDDKEKSIVEKMVDKINDVVENIALTAPNRAQFAMESNAKKMEPDPEQVAGTTNEQLYAPPSDPGLAVARQQYVEEVVATAAAPKKRAKRTPKKTAKKTAKKAAKKAAKTPPKKSAKKTKSPAIRKAVGKKTTAKKFAKKKKAKR